MKMSILMCLSIVAVFCLGNRCSSGGDDGHADGAPDADTDTDTDTDTDVDSGEVPEAVLTPISPHDLADALLSKDFLLINVHVPDAGEIPGTDIHISYLEPEALVTYIGDAPGTNVVIYCLTNSMALIAGNELVDRGYYAVRYLDGGMIGWVGAGFDLE
ncbi:MAG: rhodanese-like domain-containing protein [Proteobacteria bacterium]|nr:rhodanese-like domain-containing protein [Pseudomonadota bacterium]